MCLGQRRDGSGVEYLRRARCRVRRAVRYAAVVSMPNRGAGPQHDGPRSGTTCAAATARGTASSTTCARAGAADRERRDPALHQPVTAQCSAGGRRNRRGRCAVAPHRSCLRHDDGRRDGDPDRRRPRHSGPIAEMVPGRSVTPGGTLPIAGHRVEIRCFSFPTGRRSICRGMCGPFMTGSGSGSSLISSDGDTNRSLPWRDHVCLQRAAAVLPAGGRAGRCRSATRP